MSTRASRDDASMISATNIKLLHTIMMSARLKNYLAVLLYVSVFSLLAQGEVSTMASLGLLVEMHRQLEMENDANTSSYSAMAM